MEEGMACELGCSVSRWTLLIASQLEKFTANRITIFAASTIFFLIYRYLKAWSELTIWTKPLIISKALILYLNLRNSLMHHHRLIWTLPKLSSQFEEFTAHHQSFDSSQFEESTAHRSPTPQPPSCTPHNPICPRSSLEHTCSSPARGDTRYGRWKFEKCTTHHRKSPVFL